MVNNIMKQTCMQVFLREGEIQRGNGPNEHQRREPLGGSVCLRLHFVHFQDSAMWKQTADSELRVLENNVTVSREEK